MTTDVQHVTLQKTMHPIKIYHNPKCSNSRNTLALIQAHGYQPEIVMYFETPLTREELKNLIQATGGSVRALMREKEPIYTQLRLDQSNLSEEMLIDAILSHPVLMNRPIVITVKGTRLCRPPERVLEILP